jgi:hypothetical protein
MNSLIEALLNIFCSSIPNLSQGITDWIDERGMLLTVYKGGNDGRV